MSYSLKHRSSFDFTRSVPFSKGLVLDLPHQVREKISRTHMDVAVAYVKDPMNHESDPASMLFCEILAVLYVMQNIPEECVHPLVDQDALDSWFRFIVQRYPHRLETANDILDPLYVQRQLEIARWNALDNIVGLDTKYRHSRTLRDDFIHDFKGLFPDTAALIAELSPSKTDNRQLDFINSNLEGMEAIAASRFLGYSL